MLRQNEVGKQPNKLNPSQKIQTVRINGSRVPFLTSTLQPWEINVKISLWNIEDEGACEDSISGDGGKDWRIEIQRKGEWNGRKNQRILYAWKQIGKEDFINSGFFLRFKDQTSQQRLKEKEMIVPFIGTKKEKEAFQDMLKEELEEGIVIPIQQDQVKWWNHTFLINKLNRTWRKILDASKLNKEIENLHFKMLGLGEVQYLANQMDYVTSIDLKSAFHHITISPYSIPYLAFNFNNNNFAYKAVPFGTKDSPIFFAEAIESILRQIRIHSEIKIMNYCDDILLIHQDKQILKTQTIEIMKTLEQFGWTISKDKCEIDQKLIIAFMGSIKNLKEINI
ncbi:MAG: putative reverse transcriptase [Streblomastix strix]|uniref:Putative reverse transcriptase n=1 Tax=Streblomastix strix TaxID=222440 RepID=A0A5J4X8Q9_9EUKA|nr:MAG: putative reverse transcriptase [Streblomastix strix]